MASSLQRLERRKRSTRHDLPRLQSQDKVSRKSQKPKKRGHVLLTTMIALVPFLLFSLRAASVSRNLRLVVDFRPFTGHVELHNVTVSGETMPGPFYNDQLFLLGARLTPSWHDSTVHVDLFGFPGDWFTRPRASNHEIKDEEPSNRPPACSTEYPFGKTLWSYEKVSKELKLYCQIECTADCPEIPMELIPLVSNDPNQDDTTFIWRCNVSSYLSKEDLAQESYLDDNKAIRIHFWSKEQSGSTEAVEKMTKITTVDIPLSTGVVGHAGPQIRSSTSTSTAVNSYFAQEPFKVGLCVDVYGLSAQKYLPEFVQHHKNVGFEQIVIGIEGTLDSEEIRAARVLLSSYIDEGTVLLAADGLNNYFTCHRDFHKFHFYHQCLYHYKGIAEYSATWDLDEYWVPPSQLEIQGKHRFKHVHEGDRRRLSIEDDGSYITQSDWSAFPPLVTQDVLWQQSNYSHSISISDVMTSIDRYYTNIGCDQRWCYHLFPSQTVHLRQDVGLFKRERTHRSVDDFYRRDSSTSYNWRKGIVNTRFAYMGGMHVAGSCKFDDGGVYNKLADRWECRPHLFEPEVYGSVHHFMNLMAYRFQHGEHDVDKLGLPEDEYVTMYGRTVLQQIDGIRAKSSSV